MVISIFWKITFLKRYKCFFFTLDNKFISFSGLSCPESWFKTPTLTLLFKRTSTYHKMENIIRLHCTWIKSPAVFIRFRAKMISEMRQKVALFCLKTALICKITKIRTMQKLDNKLFSVKQIGYVNII